MLKSVPYYNRITEFRLSLITIIMEPIDMTRYLAYLLISILTFGSVCCAAADRKIHHAVSVNAVVLQILKGAALHRNILLLLSKTVVMGSNAAGHIVEAAIFYGYVF